MVDKSSLKESMIFREGDTFWPDKDWPVKLGKLFYANQIGPRGFQNLTAQLVFISFDTWGNYLGNWWWKKAQKESRCDQLQQMSLKHFLLILTPLCDL